MKHKPGNRTLFDEILNATIVFWACNRCPGSRVRWVNSHQYAVCENCGRKSTDQPSQDCTHEPREINLSD